MRSLRSNFKPFYFFMKKFYTQKKHKMQTSNFYSDIFIHLKSIKNKQVTFTHKKAPNVKQVTFSHKKAQMTFTRKKAKAEMTFTHKKAQNVKQVTFTHKKA